MSSGPTRGATEVTGAGWTSRPMLAAAVRVAIFVAPIAIGWIAVRQTKDSYWRPDGTLGLIVWIAQALIVAGLASHATAKLVNRLAPLSTLLTMTLVFPDHAPARFGVALRAGTLKKLSENDLILSDDVQEAAEQAVALVSRLNKHDRATRGHTERVRAYAEMIGREMGFDDERLERLRWSTLLHDVGKLGVHPDILNKPGRPTDAEWARLKMHPAIGGAIVRPLRPWLGDALLAVSQHHERWDGDGYPAGLAGEEIALEARIACVADTYDVITSKRSYKAPMSPAAARQELVDKAGTQFDPGVVKAFLRVGLTEQRSAGFLSGLFEAPAFSSVAHGVSHVPVAIATAVVVSASAVAGAVIPHAPDVLAFKEPPASTTTVADGDPTMTAPPTTVTAIAPSRSSTTGATIDSATTRSSTTTGVPTTSSTTTTATSTTSTTAPATTTTTPATSTTTPATTTTTTTAPATTTTSPATTTTSPATTTTAAPTTTTTTLPPIAETWSMGASGPNSVAYLPLDGALSSGGLPNYDQDRNDDPGLTVNRGSGLAEADGTKMQRWFTPLPAETVLSGQPRLEIWAATRELDPSKSGMIVAGIYDCRTNKTDCVPLGSGSAAFAQSTFGDGFGRVVITMPPIDHTLAGNRGLMLKVAVPNDSEDDLWLAFATTTYPTALTIG